MESEIQINNTAGVCQIDIEGTIGVPEEWQFEEPDARVATYERFRDTLRRIAEIEAPEVVVNIRSTGGDVNDALLIHDALRQLPARVTTRCYGYTASAATIIAQLRSFDHFVGQSRRNGLLGCEPAAVAVVLGHQGLELRGRTPRTGCIDRGDTRIGLVQQVDLPGDLRGISLGRTDGRVDQIEGIGRGRADLHAAARGPFLRRHGPLGQRTRLCRRRQAHAQLKIKN